MRYLILLLASLIFISCKQHSDLAANLNGADDNRYFAKIGQKLDTQSERYQIYFSAPTANENLFYCEKLEANDCTLGEYKALNIDGVKDQRRIFTVSEGLVFNSKKTIILSTNAQPGKGSEQILAMVDKLNPISATETETTKMVKYINLQRQKQNTKLPIGAENDKLSMVTEDPALSSICQRSADANIKYNGLSLQHPANAINEVLATNLCSNPQMAPIQSPQCVGDGPRNAVTAQWDYQSPAHRAIVLLSTVTKVGVATAKAGNYTIYCATFR